MTDAEYEKWLKDPARHQYRIVLFEFDYAAPGAGEGHGRSNSFTPLLNPVSNLRARTYDADFVEITWTQPTAQEGYSWEVWVNGKRLKVTSRGDYRAPAPQGSTPQIAVSSVNSQGEYSIPHIVNVQMIPRQDVTGSAGDWANIGIGAGGSDVGTLRLATRDWLSDTHVPYSGSVIGQPTMQDSLDDFLSVGDVEAINLKPSLNWQDLRWNGYECRWFLGDEEWSIEDFRQIATTLIDNCRLTDYGTYQFDLMDGAQFLRRPFLTVDTNRDISAKSTINFIMVEAGLPPVVYFNVPQASRDFKINIDMTTDTTIDEALEKIASSIGAYVRVGQTGQVEIFRPDIYAPPVTTLTIDDIVPDDVSQIEVTAAYSSVRVTLGRDVPDVTGPTGAFTGTLDEEVVIDTVLFQTFDAETVRDENILFYKRGHAIWEVPAREKLAMIQVGNIVAVEHPKFTGQGLVRELYRAPLSQFSTINLETL